MIGLFFWYTFSAIVIPFNCTNLIFGDVELCALELNISPINNHTVSNTTDTWFPPGITRILWTDLETNETCIMSIEFNRTQTPCGEYGYCSDEYPYQCVCPDGTGGNYCCHITNTTNNEVCGPNGYCRWGAVCECLDGYGGDWCCPVSQSSNTTCDGNGCCQFDGTCSCFNGSDDPACMEAQPSPVLSNLQIAAVASVSIVAGSALLIASLRLALPQQLLTLRRVVIYP